MAIINLQYETAISTTPAAATIAKAFGSNVTAGNFLVCLVQGDNGAVSGVSGGGTWALAKAQLWNFDSQTAEIWYCANATGGATTVTATFVSNSQANMFMGEYSGLTTASPLDKTASAESTPPGSNTDPATSGATATTSQASELVIGNISVAVSTDLVATNGNTIKRSSTNSGSGSNAYYLEQILSSTGTPQASGTETATQWGAVVATFSASSVGVRVPYQPNYQMAPILAQ